MKLSPFKKFPHKNVNIIARLYEINSSNLNALSQRLQLVGRELDGGGALGDERHDGDTGVTADDGAVDVGRVQSLLLG